MGFRKNPAALKANDKERWMLPAPDRKEQYAMEPDRRFPEPERQPSYTLSEPEYDYSQRRYVPEPTPSYYGPHFEKGSSQKEIWDTRKTKDIWRSEKEMKEVPFREEYRNRANSFHQPIQKHEYSNPYETRPKEWTDHMRAEHDEYHRLSDIKPKGKAVIQKATKTKVGYNYTPTLSQGQALMDGISAAKAIRIDANRAVQARSGFDQKYPQGYRETGLQGHNDQIDMRRTSASKHRDFEKSFERKYETWDVSIRDVQPRR